MRKINLILPSILAGVAIGIGGVIYLSIENKVIGAVLFSIGLYLICVHNLNLFTGKVGYVIQNQPTYIIDLLIIWFGNLVGTIITSNLIRNSRIGERITEAAELICIGKLNDTLISLFILGIFCGILMYGAVEGYKRTSNPLILLMGVSTFILCGFEHCVADMFYFSMADVAFPDSFLRLIIITLGNTFGALALSLHSGGLKK